MLVKEFPRSLVVRRGRKQLMARKDAARVRVRNKHRVPAGVKQDGVGGFWADPLKSQELGARFSSALSKERV